MKTISTPDRRHSEPSVLSGKPLTIREITDDERARYKELEGRNHYMGEGHPAGDTLRLVVESEGTWVACFSGVRQPTGSRIGTHT